jgi:hypothetical protein
MILALLACVQRDEKTDGLFEDVFGIYPAVSESTCPEGEDKADCDAGVALHNEEAKAPFTAAFEDETQWNEIIAGEKDLTFEVSRRRWAHSSTEDALYTDVSVTILPENQESSDESSETALGISVENYLTTSVEDPDPVRILSGANDAYFGVNDTTFEEFVKINRNSFYEDEGYEISGSFDELEVTAGILYSLGEDVASKGSCEETDDGEICESVLFYEAK